MMSDYEKTVPYDTRVKLSNDLMTKYNNRIPIIIQRMGDKLPEVEKKKFLVCNTMTLGQLVHIIRRRSHIDSTVSLILIINNRTYSLATIVGEIYDSCKNSDGFLYIYYKGENAFG